ncbi:MAG: cytochrome c3 family protein [Coriobacteriales bacterium]|jgi:hypothetical protein|nr:cytochrome c3 family protein [Coriobacteriales bacterium]
MSEENVMTDQESTDGQEPVENQQVDSESDASDEGELKPKKKGKLGIKILIVVAIVVVLLGAGGGGAYAVFHDDPAFCNFLCHVPMDPYVASYDEGISINPAQADSNAPLSVVAHKESAQQLNCLSCHVTTMPEQISEGISWVTGNYEVPLEMKVVSKQIEEVIGGDKNGVSFCLRPECHEGITTLEELEEATADEARNPHEDAHFGGVLDCSSCHQIHEQSVNMCSQCHPDSTMPAGWLTYAEAQAQKKS